MIRGIRSLNHIWKVWIIFWGVLPISLWNYFANELSEWNSSLFYILDYSACCQFRVYCTKMGGKGSVNMLQYWFCGTWVEYRNMDENKWYRVTKREGQKDIWDIYIIFGVFCILSHDVDFCTAQIRREGNFETLMWKQFHPYFDNIHALP